MAALAGEAFGARIEIGFCRYEPLTVNALGLPMASVRDRKPPPDLSFCRPDEFVRLIIEPVPDIEFSADHIDLVPVSFGTDYVGWVKANVEPNGQCCFLDRGPMHHGDTMVVADGHGSTQVTGLDAETLVPVWTTDLATLLLGDGRDRVGDSSHLLAVTDAGTVLTTTGFGSIVALDPDSGELRWVADLEQETPAGLSIVDETRAVVAISITTEGDLTAPTVRMIDLGSGAEVWGRQGQPGNGAAVVQTGAHRRPGRGRRRAQLPQRPRQRTDRLGHRLRGVDRGTGLDLATRQRDRRLRLLRDHPDRSRPGSPARHRRRRVAVPPRPDHGGEDLDLEPRPRADGRAVTRHRDRPGGGHRHRSEPRNRRGRRLSLRPQGETGGSEPMER